VCCISNSALLVAKLQNRAAEPSRTPRATTCRTRFRVLTGLTHYASSIFRYHLSSAPVHSRDPTPLQCIVGNWCQWGGMCQFVYYSTLIFWLSQKSVILCNMFYESFEWNCTVEFSSMPSASAANCRAHTRQHYWRQRSLTERAMIELPLRWAIPVSCCDFCGSNSNRRSSGTSQYLYMIVTHLPKV
jgi:hypothetical protein